jgi:LacI family transcriptional regulator
MKKKQRISIKALASRLSLSVCTVSRILNDRMGMAKYRPETIERVRETARKFGYRPHLLARSLVTGSSRTIGLCIADISNPFYASIASCIEEMAVKDQYVLIIMNTQESVDLERQSVAALLDRNVDVLVVSPVKASAEWIHREAAEQGARVVLFDRCRMSSDKPWVLVNNREASRDLVARAIALGHRRIAVLAGDTLHESLNLRLCGVQDALRDAGIEEDGGLVVVKGSKGTTAGSGYEAMTRLVEMPQRPAFVFSLTNVLSEGALQAAFQLGVKIPADISFAGFDDFPGSEMIPPGITVIEQPVREIARACYQAAITKETDPSAPEILPARVIWRNSVTAPT